jgi:sucrose-6-phosphate hydrolase SacC (GH32 family)
LGQCKVTSNVLRIGSSKSARLTISVDLPSSDAISFTISLFKSDPEAVLLTFHPSAGSLTLDTTNAGYGQPGKWKAFVAKPDDKGFSMDIFLGRSVVEIFLEDGSVFSANIFSRSQEPEEISIVINRAVLAVHSIALRPVGSSWR